MRYILVFTGLLLGAIALSSASEVIKEDVKMVAKGTFEVNLAPQDDASFPAGRMVIDKIYRGDMNGSGAGQMISKRIEGGVSVYYAIEEFSGSIKGKKGSFTLVHDGYMGKESQSLKIIILEGSGSGDFENITGSMRIIRDNGGHAYELSYEL